MIVRTSLALTALAAGLFLVISKPASAELPKVGKPIPSFSMTDLAGKKHTNSTLKGKVVLLDFWASWCGPCKAASPVMQALHAKYGSKGLVVIGANVSEHGKSSKQAATEYKTQHKFTYTFTHDNDSLAEKWGIDGIPQFFLIDKKGKVAWAMSGFDPNMQKTLDAKIASLLK